MFHSPVVAGHRLFFALRPPIEVARRIIAASAWLGGDLLRPDHLHITLLILDDLLDVPPGLVAVLREIGAAVNAAPFTVTLERLVTTGRWAALRPGGVNASLRDLYDQLARLARAAGVAERVGHQCNPHLTLGYRATVARNERIQPVSWAAGELLLIDSHVGLTRHVVKGRWPLIGDPEPQLSLF